MHRITKIKIMFSTNNILFIVLLTSFSTLCAQPVTWDLTASYSLGTLVITETDGVSYVSIQQVPVNTEISNTSYWSSLSAEASSLLAPSESVPSIDTVAILADLPGAPSDANSSSGSTTVRFLGISTRGNVSSSQSMYGGIDILGSGKKTIAFFGRGASMPNVSNFVSDPSLQVYKDTTGNENWELITTNDNWGTLSETGGTYSIASVSTVSSSQGITMPTNSYESGVVVTVDAGFRYAAILNSSSSITQEAIIEAYEITTPTESVTSNLLGISTRGIVSSSQSMYGGIDVLGSGKRKIAFFARGASMPNVLNFVSDPSLQVYKDTTGNENWELIATNDNWGTLSVTGGIYSIASISTVSTSQGVTMPTNAYESGLVLTVDAGFRYAAILNSSSVTTQEAIIEAYEVD
jgi:uncharacterized membrane protein YjfL (UPF0719 family)